MTAETFRWVDPDGTTLDIVPEWDIGGRVGLPARVATRIVPGQPGGRIDDISHGPRTVDLAWTVRGADMAEVRDQIRRLAYLLDPVRGAGRLVSRTVLGDARELACVCNGLGVLEQLGGGAGHQSQRIAATFLAAEEPYWLDPVDTEAVYSLGAVAGSTFFPFFPLVLSASEMRSEILVTQSGDVETWPVWTITGPAATVELTSAAGTTLVDDAIAAGETMTIDTRPGRKTVRDAAGANILSRLSTSSVFWPLRRGDNLVTVVLAGGTEASSVRVAFRRRWLSA